MDSQDSSSLTKLILNNFIVQGKPRAQQGKVCVIKKLLRTVKKLREKKADNDLIKAKFNRRAEKLVEEVMILKRIAPIDIMKFIILNKKSFTAVASNPKAKIEERALCRLATHKGISAIINKFREQYPKWAEEVPVLLKGLGILHRKKKLERLKRRGKLEKYLEKEQRSLKLLQELTNIDIDPKIIKGAIDMSEEIKKEKANSKSRKRKKEGNMTPKVVKRKLEETEKNKIYVENISKGNNIEMGESGSKKSGSLDDDTDDASDDKTTDKKLKKIEIVRKKAISEDDNSSEEENENEVNGGNIKNKDNGDMSDCEVNVGDTSDCEDNVGDTSDFVVQSLSQNLQHKEQTGNNSESKDESSSEEELEHSDSYSESGEDGLTVTTECRNVENPSISKVSKASRIAEVKQLDLKNIDGTIEGDHSSVVSDSEDEAFFVGKTASKKNKKSKKSSFFLGSGNCSEDLEDSDEESEGEDRGQRPAKESYSNAEDSDDIDTGKYLRMNMFRLNCSRRGADRGRGGNRGRGSGRGHTVDRSRVWDRGQSKNRGWGGNWERGSGRREENWKRVIGENYENSSKIERNHGDFKNKEKEVRRGRERDYNWNEEREIGRGGRGNRRGGRGIAGNEKHRRGTFNQESGNRFQNQGARRENGRQFSWKSDSSNPNMIPLPRKDDTSGSTPKPAAAAAAKAPPQGGSSRGGTQSLHPSWQAKLREREQSVSINQFQGKRLVFNDD